MHSSHHPKSLDTDLTHFIKGNTKSIIDLSIKHTTLRLRECKIRKSLDDLGYNNGILDVTSKA